MPLWSTTTRLAERIRADDGAEYTAVCFVEAKGHPVTEQDRGERLLKRMGQFMGRLHAGTKGYNHENPVTKRPDWSAESDIVAGIELSASEADIMRRYAALREYIAALPKSADAYGLIHADFHYGNFFLDGEDMWLYDFDACRYSWFADDIARALSLRSYGAAQSLFALFFFRFRKEYFENNYWKETLSVAEIVAKRASYELKNTRLSIACSAGFVKKRSNGNANPPPERLAILLGSACDTRTAFYNRVLDGLPAPEVERQDHRSVIRITEEIRGQRDFIVRIVGFEAPAPFLVRSPVLRTGVAACSVHGFHRG
jgi:aminoglycoside phosphotransferase (APT) family kinase protein